MSTKGMTFTKKQIKEFLEELNNLSSPEQRQLFYSAIKKKADEITGAEGRAIIAKANFLSDDERYKFRNLLVEENLTDEEKKRWLRLYPIRTNMGKQVPPSYMNKMFPKRKDVDSHYKKHFLQGRSA